MKANAASEKAVLVVAISLILFGIVANEWVLTYLFSYNQPNRFPYKLLAIRVTDFLFIAAGIGLLFYRRKPRVSAFAVNLLVFTCSSAIVIALLEVTFPWIQESIPVHLRRHIPYPYGVLSQPTKRSFVPKDYVALFGDSYAEGVGDWFLEEGKSSVDILAHESNQDAITFGRSGASSITGVVLKPLIALRRLRYRVEIERPNLILIYFS